MILTQEQIEYHFGKFVYTSNPDGSIKILSKDFLENIIPFVYVFNSGKKLIWKVHKKIYIPLLKSFDLIKSTGLENLIDYEDTQKVGGCFVPRHILWNTSKPLSHHSWGIAFDINPTSNPYNKPPTPNQTKLAGIFINNGFEWGAKWKTPDPQHFEYTAVNKRN